MRLMCWDMDIVHRNDIYLANADYWSRLGEDICYDPLFKAYLDFDRGLRETFPAPTDLPTLPENMPYYRGPRVVSPPSADEQTTDVNHCQSLFTQVLTHESNGLCHLSVNPIKFGEFDTVTPSEGHASTNHEFSCYAQQVLRFSWAVYSFSGGHFASTIRLAPFHSVSNLLAISTTLVAPYSKNSLSAHKSSSTARICSITSAHLATVLK
jgi:hypothetical protein